MGKEHEANNARLAARVMDLLDDNGLGELARKCVLDEDSQPIDLRLTIRETAEERAMQSGEPWSLGCGRNDLRFDELREGLEARVGLGVKHAQIWGQGSFDNALQCLYSGDFRLLHRRRPFDFLE